MNSTDIMTPEIAKKTIEGCIEDYLRALEKERGYSKTTIRRYNSMLKSALLGFQIPFMSISTKLLNKHIEELCEQRGWSNNYINSLVTAVNGLFYWAKYIKCDGPYTLKDVVLNKPVRSCSKVITSSTNTADTQKLPTDFTNLENFEKSPKSPVLLGHIVKRNIALLELMNRTSLTADEISRLNIYDFLHTHIIVQSVGNPENVRIVVLQKDISKLIYEYLITRQDNHISLFMDKTGESGITKEEIDIVHSINK